MAPNSTLWNTPITNFSREAQRRQLLSIAVAADSDIQSVKQTVAQIIKSDQRVSSNPLRASCQTISPPTKLPCASNIGQARAIFIRPE